jgi:hypothetical protein
MGYDRVDCKKIERPIPVISRVVNAKGNKLYGFYYAGDKYVFIREGLDPELEQAVIFHETIHYLLFEGYDRGVGRCESEQAARIATDLYNSVPYDPWWEEPYRCVGYFKEWWGVHYH